MEHEKNEFKTHIQAIQELMATDPEFYKNLSGEEGALSAAKYFDSFQMLNASLQILVMQQAAKINKEILFELKRVCDPAVFDSAVRRITNQHRHHKVAIAEKDGSHVE